MKVLSGLGLEERQEPVDNAPEMGEGDTRAPGRVTAVGPYGRKRNNSEVGTGPLGERNTSRRVRISEQREVRFSSVSEREERQPRHVSELRRDRENRSSEERSSRYARGKRTKHRRDERKRSLMPRRGSLTPRSRYSTSSDRDGEDATR